MQKPGTKLRVEAKKCDRVLGTRDVVTLKHVVEAGTRTDSPISSPTSPNTDDHDSVAPSSSSGTPGPQPSTSRTSGTSSAESSNAVNRPSRARKERKRATKRKIPEDGEDEEATSLGRSIESIEKAFEQSNKQVKELKNNIGSASHSTPSNLNKVSKKSNPKLQDRRTRSNKSSISKAGNDNLQFDCKYCGYKHERKRVKCPPWGKTCDNCKGLNHFKSNCSKKVHAVVSQSDNHNDPNNDFNDKWLFAINDEETGVTANLSINDHIVKFQLDSATDVNTICQKHVGRQQVSPTNIRRNMWNKINLKPLGENSLTTINPSDNTQHEVKFIVVPNGFMNLLGLNTTQELGFITINCNWICIDPQPLNSALQREHYRLPVLDDVLPKLKNAKVFSKLDVKEAYWHVRLDKQSSKLTTMITPFGRHRWKSLPFGLKVSSEIFQRKIYEALEDLSGVFNIVDDIIIVGCGATESEAFADNNQNFSKCIQRCKERNITLNEDKQETGLTDITFHGHKITSSGIEVDKAKVKAIVDMPVLTDGSELHLADTLIRAHLNSNGHNQDNRARIMNVNIFGNIPDAHLEEIQEATKKDNGLQGVMEPVMNGWPDGKRNIPPSALPYFDIRDTLSAADGVLLKGEAIVIPQSLSPAELMFKRKTRSLVPSFNKHSSNDPIEVRRQARKDTVKKSHDRKAKSLPVPDIGQSIFFQHLEGRDWKFGEVSNILGPSTYEVKRPDGSTDRRNRVHDHLRPTKVNLKTRDTSPSHVPHSSKKRHQKNRGRLPNLYLVKWQTTVTTLQATPKAPSPTALQQIDHDDP
ncbi:Retrovirus-related Pol polyprotein [Stylophora pistillata]|uniref:Retrovirus-related Pol polyprotein n=1 Tax=Stylophora pistillata TaxID=50429 RepID=A0A2B4R9P5_STYPI|nr:Retrovirus-related Pol polyprotein [Stylophora pistillata]